MSGSRFNDCLAFVLAREGGKTDKAHDRGGCTAYGITQATFNAWTGTTRDVWTITQDEVRAIYRARYWDACQCDQLPQGLDLAVFDSAVQHGTENAARFLQRALHVDADGALGPITFAALQAVVAAGTVPGLITSYLSERQAFYAAIVAHDPTQAEFSTGWANRLAALKTAIGV